MVDSVDIALSYSNGTIKMQLVCKELDLDLLKKNIEGRHYLVIVNMKNKSMNVELHAKIGLPIKIVDQINENRCKGRIGNVSYLLNPNGSLTLKAATQFKPDAVTKTDSRYLIKVTNHRESIVNIKYTLPEDIYHRSIPKEVVSKAAAKALAQKITDQILSGQYPTEPKPSRKRAAVKTKPSKPKTKEPSISIRTAKDTSFKRCEHCVNMQADYYCRVHKKTVKSNNACSRFFAPRVYLGGSVSPR